MPLKTRRWDEPREPNDGWRVLICRYRPRGVAKSAETWDAWLPELGPSRELLGAFKTETASKIPWPTYRRQYLQEQRANATLIESIADRIRAGETVTLLCSSSCTRESRCHRSLLRELIESELTRPRP